MVLRSCLLAVLLFAQAVQKSAAELEADSTPCDAQRLAKWTRVKGLLRSKVSDYDGRIPFMLARTDGAVFQEIQHELGRQDIVVEESEVPGSPCDLGRLTLRAMLVLSQIAGVGPEVQANALSLLPDVLTAPWIDVIMQGWPLFAIVSILMGWLQQPLQMLANPIVFGTARIMAAPPQGSFAEGEAEFSGSLLGIHELPHSSCDRLDRGAMLEARVRARRFVGMRTPRRTSAKEAADLDALIALLQRSASDSTDHCAFAQPVLNVLKALRSLAGPMASFAPEFVVEAQASMQGCQSQQELQGFWQDVSSTAWPLWAALSKLQQRVDLLELSLPSSTLRPHPEANAVPDFEELLRRTLGMDDLAWKSAVDELRSLAEAKSGQSAWKLPQDLTEHVVCMDGRSCAAEMASRLQLLLHKYKVLPLRDPLDTSPQDSLAQLHWRRNYDIRDPGSLHGEPTLRDLLPPGHPLQPDRWQLASFVLQARSLLRSRRWRRCLEWDDPRLLQMAFRGTCEHIDRFTFSETTPDNPLSGLPGKEAGAEPGSYHYWGDLTNHSRLGIEDGSFGLLILPFVFEHLPQPFEAMKNVARILEPGGHVIWSAPMFQQYHGVPHDYFRYTPQGARHLAESAGLKVEKMYTPGSSGLVAGIATGLRMPYWDELDILKEASGDDDDRFPLNVFMLLGKPP
eukprot:TRINITY_DN65463_c0_g1_i1.p1 TRINITY_DN65463_c0_g1~~TRINITY_DN65463_c0_g1_i1.p1  ORF type:complete len:694 (-),score=93.04 TRINITY_DN65463_c0_g1_i1:57-2102(-)